MIQCMMAICLLLYSNLMLQSLIIERISKGMLLNKLHFVNFNPFRRMAIHERTFGTFFMF